MLFLEIYPILHNNVAISDNLSIGFLTWIRAISNRFKIHACRIWFPPNKRTIFHCCEIHFETEKIEFDKSFRDPQGVAQYVHTIRAKLLKDRFRYYVFISRFLHSTSRVCMCPTLFRVDCLSNLVKVTLLVMSFINLHFKSLTSAEYEEEKAKNNFSYEIVGNLT